MGGLRGLVLVLCASCGRIGFRAIGSGDGSPGGGGDAGDGPRMIDAPADAAPCVSPGPWSPPVALAINGPANDWSPALSGDTLRLIFQSNRSGNDALYEATRATTADMFGNVQLIAELDTSGSERAPTLSPDGLTIYFTSDNTGTNLLYRAVRASVTSPFAAASPVVVAGAAEVLGPDISAEGDELFYNDLAETTVYRATKVGAAITQDRAMTELGARAYVSLSRDGLTMYLSELGNPSLFVATRVSVGATFTTPVAVTGLGLASLNEEDPELGKDDRTIVFAADNASTKADLYMSTRVCN